MPKSITLVAAMLLTLALLTGIYTLLRNASSGGSNDPVAKQFHEQAQALDTLAKEFQQPISASQE